MSKMCPTAVLEINSDMTEHKQAEEALRESREDLQALARRLVELQEQERQELAHGLHDDAGQLLASLSVGLRVLEKRYGASRHGSFTYCLFAGDGGRGAVQRSSSWRRSTPGEPGQARSSAGPSPIWAPVRCRARRLATGSRKPA